MTAQVEQWRRLVEANPSKIQPAVILGLMDRVSGGDPNFVGVRDARGLFAIHPTTAEKMGFPVSSLLNPEMNIRAAIALLTRRADEVSAVIRNIRPDDLLRLTLAAYWHGPAEILAVGSSGVRTAAEVFSQASSGPQMDAFVEDVLARAAQYQASEITPPRKSRWWMYFAAVAAAGVGIAWIYKKGDDGKK